MRDKLSQKIGILGGGQLGKMMIESYSSMNLKYRVLEKSSDCPSALVCKDIIEGSLYDAEAITALAKISDVLTYEIEHVNVDALKEVEQICPVFPMPSVLELIQDKGLQKNYYRENAVTTLDFVLSDSDALQDSVNNWPDEEFVLKHRKGGYDGKGVQLLSKSSFKSLIDSGDESLKSEHGYVIEKIVKKAREFSVIVCIGRAGEVNTYRASEMVFDPKANLMDYLISPADISSDRESQLRKKAIKAVTGFNSPGIYAVEFIMDEEGNSYVNEIAPRAHNSGHHTIESCYTSQYEQLNRILLDLPLGDTTQIQHALTANILGPEGFSGRYSVEGLEEVLQVPGAYIHLYGKTTSSPYRKLGHFTVLGENEEDCVEKMNKVRESLELVEIN
ncbi:ATP-grasp domain-containing protein [bacterium]|nr:ATP-grasp domain-containing protein [bacterium]